MGIRKKYGHKELIKFSREKGLTDLEKLWRGQDHNRTNRDLPTLPFCC